MSWMKLFEAAEPMTNMHREVERKFLLRQLPNAAAIAPVEIEQGYIAISEEVGVRLQVLKVDMAHREIGRQPDAPEYEIELSAEASSKPCIVLG